MRKLMSHNVEVDGFPSPNIAMTRLFFVNRSYGRFATHTIETYYIYTLGFQTHLNYYKFCETL